MTSIAQQDKTLEDLEETLRCRICSVCVDRNVDGTCSLKDLHECVLFERIPRIVPAVSGVHSDRMDDYIAAIREKVCADCSNQDEQGLCAVREQVRCVLDRYLILIVQAIEEVQGRTLQPSVGLHLIAEAGTG